MQEPADLVRFVLDALRDGRDASVAADVLWEVAAPKFQRSVGSPEHLAHLFTNPLWRLLRDASKFVMQPSERIGDAARIHVDLLGPADEHLTTFVFTLRTTSLSDGTHEAGWHITGVAPANRLDL